MLAPDNADLALLAGRMEISRGQLEEGLAHLRRAVELEPGALQSRFALAEEVERSGSADADTQAVTLIDELAKLAPQNIAVLVERARIAAKTQDRQRLTESIERLKPMAAAWPAAAVEQYQALQGALAANDFPVAQQSTAFLRNVLARVPAFSEDLSAIRTPTELISAPVGRFIALTPPSSQPAAPDTTLSFSEEPLAERLPRLPALAVFATLPGDGDGPAQILSVDLSEVRTLSGVDVRIPYPRPPNSDAGPTPQNLAIADWNGDFRPDVVLATETGVHLFVQEADGRFTDRTPTDAMARSCVCQGVWPIDVELDGDIDLIASDQEGPSFMLRNNGDGSWTGTSMFSVTGVSDFTWADIDTDGDPDAVFLLARDRMSRVQAFTNRQAGEFVPLPDVTSPGPLAMTVADLDADGVFEIVVLEASGALRAFSLRGGRWDVRDIATWPQFASNFVPVRLIAADIDNNGATDLIGTSERQSRVWLGNASRQLQLVESLNLPGFVYSAGDLNADGRLDFMATVVDSKTPSGRAVRLLNKGTANYHWKQIRARAQETAGDQRINSFGVGGYIEVRAGLLFQKQLLTGGPVHIGLGTRTAIDVARIVWPNGVPQAEFGVTVDDGMVAEQRLKGSCPWVFAWDGTRMVFVTDFLWRSPLGPAHQRAGHGRRDADGRLGAASAATSSCRATGCTTCASPPSCGRRTSSTTSR